MDRIARYVTIYGLKIKVAFVDAIEGGFLGTSSYASGSILITEGEPHQEARTLIHEMVHIAMVDNGLNNTFDAKQKETVCDFVQHFITQMYEPNRETIEEIAAGRPLSKESHKRGSK